MMQNPHLAPCETIIHDLRAFRQHGVFRTTQVLHLEYGKLKRLAGAAATNRRLAAPPIAFLELMSPSAIGPSECVIELEGPRGKMRIQWNGATGADHGRTQPCGSRCDSDHAADAHPGGANPLEYLTELLRHAEELKQCPPEWMPGITATPWHGWPHSLTRNIINPAWPKRIVGGHADRDHQSACKTALPQDEIRRRFRPATRLEGNVSRRPVCACVHH